MIDPLLRDRLARLADVMLPGDGVLPPASRAGLADDGPLRVVLGSRPDLTEPLVRAIERLDDASFDLERLARYRDEDADGYIAITTVVASTYYLSPTVRDSIGYPGQVPRTYDPYAYVSWVEEGLLDPVISRGPRWRDPDRTEVDS